jgi:hypothetical protein
MTKQNNDSGANAAAKTQGGADPEYKVGPGRPPKEYQFKPGQSGNPKGAKRKKPTAELDFKAAFERALKRTVKLKYGEDEREVTMAVAGIEHLVAQYAKGDRHARRDVMEFAAKFDIDLVGGQRQAIQEALAPNQTAMLDAYVDRQYDKYVTPTRVIAPSELLDDDPEEQKGK